MPIKHLDGMGLTGVLLRPIIWSERGGSVLTIKGFLVLFHKKKPVKAAVWDHDWDEIKLRPGRNTPIITIAELEEERRKLQNQSTTVRSEGLLAELRKLAIPDRCPEDWDEDYYDIRPRSGKGIPHTTIEELEEECRKNREELEKLTPLEWAHMQTEWALKRLQETAI